MAGASLKSDTPRSLGYAMPAEWAPHEATWLSWPHNSQTWPTQIERVRAAWATMAAALTPHERVCLLVNDAAEEADAAARLRAAGADGRNLRFFRIPTVDVWIRDYGPTFVLGSGAAPLACNDWIFNGWGGKYPGYERDDSVAEAIASALGVPVFRHPVVLEGGSFDVNGAGSCLTTEQCLLHPNRNPSMDRREIEEFLRAALGLSHVIWLGEGVCGDDTDGHVDDIARFVNERTVVCALEENPRDENYRALMDNYERLKAAADQDGHRLEVIPLPCPRPIFFEDARLPASYANFYIANGVVLVPTFDDPADARALGVLRELFPDRDVVAVPCTDVVAGLGAVHCVTQQQPRVFRRGP
ncbi:MAG TPA: agmatine deiminase family protein [candidate division Zixibacteria bacterium]|nr:agmatine deiminase family protein [candidate division Zixibacteria bacterium]